MNETSKRLIMLALKKEYEDRMSEYSVMKKGKPVDSYALIDDNHRNVEKKLLATEGIYVTIEDDQCAVRFLKHYPYEVQTQDGASDDGEDLIWVDIYSSREHTDGDDEGFNVCEIIDGRIKYSLREEVLGYINQPDVQQAIADSVRLQIERSVERKRVQAALKYWRRLEDVPINEDEELDEDFTVDDVTFDRGTHRNAVWHWFEKHFNVSVATDLMGVDKGNSPNRNR